MSSIPRCSVVRRGGGRWGAGGMGGGGGDPNKMLLCKFEWNVKTAGHKNITSKGVFSNFSQAIIA